MYLSGIAVDSASYGFNYQFCRTLPLRLYYDENSNCAFDVSSEYYLNCLTSFEVDSNSIPIDTISILSGVDYKARGVSGDIYQFRIINYIPGIVPFCPSTGIITDTLTIGINEKKYIGFQCSGTPGFDLGIYTSVLAGRHALSGTAIIANRYCNPVPSTLTVIFSPKYRYRSSIPAASSVIGNVATWNLGLLSSSDRAPKTIDYTLVASSGYVPPRDTVNSSFLANPTIGDINADDNDCDRNDTVKASYDPNHIEVSPGGIIPIGTLLTYSTEFENTGNDTAHNIYVLDTLPNTLDIHTLQMVASTHPVVTSKLWNGTNWVLKFDFPNIKLLDSSYHNQCTGMYVYKIRARTTLAPGTIIPNRAGIYFDDNEVVMTNTAISEIETLPLTTKTWMADKITIFPNPATNTINIDNAPAGTYRIVDLLGKTILQGELTEGRNNISFSGFTTGIYIIEIKDAAGNKTVKKIVKE